MDGYSPAGRVKVNITPYAGSTNHSALGLGLCVDCSRVVPLQCRIRLTMACEGTSMAFARSCRTTEPAPVVVETDRLTQGYPKSFLSI